MGRGGARVGAGRPRKALAAHWLGGTWRPDRHGPKPATLAALAVSPAVETAKTEPPAEALVGLGPDGARFLRAAFADFEFSALEVEVLRMGAANLDDAAAARQRGDLKAAQSAGRQFLAALLRLGLPRTEA